jgi:hypothetical protein
MQLADNPKIVAIGATGRDYFRLESIREWCLARRTRGNLVDSYRYWLQLARG